MKFLNDMFKKNLVVYKNNLWVSRYKYNTKFEKFKNELRELSYEFLIYMKNSPNADNIRFFIYIFSAGTAYEYIRKNFVHRSKDLIRLGVVMHETMEKYDIDPPKDEADALNYNKLHYSREYTLKY
jgi:hypothetical protein